MTQAAIAEPDVILARFEEHHSLVKDSLTKVSTKQDEFNDRMIAIEQKMAGRRGSTGGDNGVVDTPGSMVARSDEFKSFGGSHKRGKFAVNVKTITSASNSAGAMIAPDKRSEVVMLAKQRLTIRDLVAPGNTESNSVQYPRQTLRTNAAAVVAEGTKKPESSFAFELKDAPVRTIAHWTKASRQAMDDAPMLQSTIDGELRYGLQLAEEMELLFGDGTGQHILGIMPQAEDYDTDRNQTGDTMFDIIAHALAQAEVALLPATGIVLNTDDLEAMKIIKDDDGRYIGGGPFGPPITSLWGRPVVGTPNMPNGEFLVGAFRDGAQIFDRWDAQVLISTENEDDFVKNLLTILAEQRLALAVKRPAAFIRGEF